MYRNTGEIRSNFTDSVKLLQVEVRLTEHSLGHLTQQFQDEDNSEKYNP